MEKLQISVDKKFQSLHNRLDLNDLRVTKLEEMLASGNIPATDGKMSKEIEVLKIEIEALETKHVEPEVLECTSLVGGLSSLHTLENAKTWITDKLWKNVWADPRGNLL